MRPGFAAEAHDLEFEGATSGPLVLAGATASILIEQLKPSLAPDSCRWCDRSSDGRESLNGLDAAMRRSWRWADVDKADDLSDGLAYGAVPLTVLGLNWGAAGSGDEAAEDLVIVAEATVVSQLLNKAVKYSVARQRPCAHFGGPCGYRHPQEENLSFYSGHASFTFATAAAAGTVADLRGYRSSTVVWITGMTLAAATSYLRVAADRHYFTDVLVGAVVGSAVGIAVPRLFHSRVDEDETAVLSSRDPMIVVSFRF